MTLAIEVLPDPAAVAARGAAFIAAAARAGVAATGSFAMAVSGGTTPWAMFAALGALPDVPWDGVGIWQVDERIAPDGDDERGLTHLLANLPAAVVSRVHAMPVGGLDPGDQPALDAAAIAYGAGLPPAFDLVHLGLGEDGHTASLVPGDPALGVRDLSVAITGVYRGRRRMTLTFPVLDHASLALWVVTGAEKARALRKLRDGDSSMPASHVNARERIVLTDTAAASRL